MSVRPEPAFIITPASTTLSFPSEAPLDGSLRL